MVEFWDGFIEILKILIPTITGAVSSKVIINSWQMKKEEFHLNKEKHDLKQKILDYYERAYLNQMRIMNDFVEEVMMEYTVGYNIEPETKKIVFKLQLPNEKEKQPLVKFANEYKEFRKNMNENLLNVGKLFSTVRVYYELKDIDENMIKISGISAHIIGTVDLIMYSTTQEEMIANTNAFYKSRSELSDAGNELSHTLATCNIRSSEPKDKGTYEKIKKVLKK